MTIGDRIKKRRMELGISVEDLANTLGKARATLYRYENGDIPKLPSTVIEPLAEALKTTPSYLLDWKTDKNDTSIHVGNKAQLKDRLFDALQIRNVRAVDLALITNIPKSTLSLYLSGKSEPKKKRISVLSKALKVSEPWLMGFDVPMEGTSPIEKNITSKHAGVRINVLGRVAAGVPIEVQQEIIDWEEISEEMAATGQFFALQIHGDSMLPRIQDGDVVIVRQQPDIDSGDVAIVMVNGSDATCKRVAKYSDGIRLIPNNPSYEPVFYSNEEIESKPVKVIGKVVELRGKF